ncbi:MAG: hypothetical protein Q8L47_04580 [bacterium]|nr:hypothetical protein [bacterium]
MLKIIFVIKYFVVVYLLNFFWEAWHAYYLYWGYAGKSFKDYSALEYLALISRVSLVDASLLVAILLIGFLIWKDIFWMERMFKKFARAEALYFFVATVGIAIWIEIKGVYLFREWSYLLVMPIIFGLGLSPIIQLFATGFISFWILRKNTN